ncbi:glycosyltransferase family 4 protein [Bacteriovorax sp. Seq25_V]|uniref:glycosyltransferase family 4 protein n=1 Tax=Bacteriovorax sp. Seq25_V TaxID=1201288 RepID=UPI00054E6574|nr:glycosyltransferase family 4 protein [Bacteriovorax sp. Seq25_V]
MTKTILIYDNQRSEWDSVQSIKTNLLASYNLLENVQYEEYSITIDTTSHELYCIYERIVKSNPDKVVFVDGVPHPSVIIPLFKSENFKDKFEIIFHIYGDFTIKLSEWANIESVLKDFNCKFLCASPKQVDLIKKFIIDSDENVELCPFAIDSNTYFHSEDLRKNTRHQLSIQDDEIVFCYTGRLSYQKNIHSLINYFYQVYRVFRLKCKFYIIGEFDDLGAPFIGKHFPNSYYFNKIFDVYKDLPEIFREKLIFTGKLSSGELNKFYNASDLFVSFSVHNDEDFGMSPLEALATGTPCIITDWGGYSAFRSEYCKTITTKIEIDSIKIDFSLAAKETLKVLHSKFPRKEVSDYYQSKMTQKSTTEYLKNMKTPTRFKGFSEIMHTTNSSFKANPGSPLSDSKICMNAYSDLYKRLYSSYES